MKIYLSAVNIHYILGLTEAGPRVECNHIISVSALSILINKGIGDTIRVSLTPETMNSRTEEVEVCQQLLSSLGIRNYIPKVISYMIVEELVTLTL